ncbi:hypothetical protein [Streptomyces niveus]|uniref:hypothetical protein n=1 Tax=Streptomyces niveus TaxID=193462 RepID=UPI003862DD5E
MPRRSRSALAACATLLALAACPAAMGTATAAPTAPTPVTQRAQNGLPPIGAEIPFSMLAVNSPFRIGDELVSLDFRGGIKQRVDVNRDDPFNSVRLRTIGFRVSAELPGDGGTVTFEQYDVDVEASSTLTMTQRFPPKYEHTIVVPVTATIDRPGQDPVVLFSKGPMVFSAPITQFPPRGDQYQLRAPVDFVAEENAAGSEKAEATLEKFPARVGGL